LDGGGKSAAGAALEQNAYSRCRRCALPRCQPLRTALLACHHCCGTFCADAYHRTGTQARVLAAKRASAAGMPRCVLRAAACGRRALNAGNAAWNWRAALRL